MARITMEANAKEADGFLPIPDGEYILTCTKVTDKTASTGRAMANLELTVGDGEYEGRKVWHNVTFIPKGEDGHGFMVHALHAFGLPFDGSLDFDTSEFRGRSCKAQVNTETYKGKANNKIADFITVDGGSAAPAAAKSAAAAPTPAKQASRF